MKGEKMTGNQYYQIAESLWSDKNISTSLKKQYCSHVGRDGKYCTATTHKSCKNCRFFVPTFYGKIVVLVQNILDREDEIKRLKQERDMLKMDVRYYKHYVKQIKQYMREKEDYSSIGKSIIRHRNKKKKQMPSPKKD